MNASEIKVGMRVRSAFPKHWGTAEYTVLALHDGNTWCVTNPGFGSGYCTFSPGGVVPCEPTLLDAAEAVLAQSLGCLDHYNCRHIGHESWNPLVTAVEREKAKGGES